MKQILVRSCNAQEDGFRRKMEMLRKANRLVEGYIRETSLGRDEIVDAIVAEVGIDAGTVNWMML